MNKSELIDFIVSSFKSESAMRSLLGTALTEPFLSLKFNGIPYDKAEVFVKDGRISEIMTWSGLNWSARHGYGSPLVHVKLEDA